MFKEITPDDVWMELKDPNFLKYMVVNPEKNTRDIVDDSKRNSASMRSAIENDLDIYFKLRNADKEPEKKKLFQTLLEKSKTILKRKVDKGVNTICSTFNVRSLSP